MARDWSLPDEHREIVEIGAVRIMDAATAPKKIYFSQLVIPRINPVLSDYFIDLTGITQAELDDNGTDYPNALQAFGRFIQGTDMVYSYGCDGDVMVENCAMFDIACPDAIALSTNVRKTLNKHYGLGPKVTSSDLPTATGLKTGKQYRAHRALDDARAVAHVLLPYLLSEKLIA